MPAPQAIYDGLAKAIKDHLTTTYGPPVSGDRLGQMTSVMLMKLSMDMMKANGITSDQAAEAADNFLKDWENGKQPTTGG